MNIKVTIGAASFTLLMAASAQAATYLNYSNMTVSLGPTMSAEPFVDITTATALSNAIDAETAASGEGHAAGAGGTHVWYNSTTTPLELNFEFDKEYDLTTLHFWNYFTEFYDVDEINFSFFDAGLGIVGALDFFPDTGTSSPETAQDYILSFPSKVQYVNALFSGTNGQVDFNNIGFTGDASNPEPGAIPIPAGLPLVLTGLAGFAGLRMRKKRKAQI